MAAKRGRRELQAGVERLENLWDNMVEKHLSERDYWQSVCGTVFALLSFR